MTPVGRAFQALYTRTISRPIGTIDFVDQQVNGLDLVDRIHIVSMGDKSSILVRCCLIVEKKIIGVRALEDFTLKSLLHVLKVCAGHYYRRECTSSGLLDNMMKLVKLKDIWTVENLNKPAIRLRGRVEESVEIDEGYNGNPF